MRFLRIVATASLLLTPCAVGAQEAVVDTDPPAHVSLVEGTAVIERDGKVDNAPANMPLLAGDRVRTETGRVEILFADGSTLHLDNFTTVDFQSDELVRVLDGRVRLTIAGRQRNVGYRLDGAGAWAQISEPGEYRFAVLRREGQLEVELAVLRGAAELVNDDGRTPLRAGERALARAGVAPSYAYVFNSASWDAFDRWSETRRDQRLGLSAQYLPEPVHAYSRDFDRYGSWQHEPTHGYVWYPTVAVSWRPYYHGRWTSLRPYGWVWVGTDRWSWATHHYGRWGISAGRWFWIPGRTWGPAWVSWGYSPDYVSWCPLGWNNRPLFQINVNRHSRGYDPWRAWTVVRRSHFGRDYVHRRVVSAHLLDARARSNWEFRDRGPDFRGYAVARADAPIRTVGRAIPRGGSSSAPVYTNRTPGDSRVESNGRRIQVGEGRSDGVAPDGRSRAVPRAGADVPRMMPERGVRSAPGIRSSAADGDDGGSRPSGSVTREPESRAVPRGNAGDAGRASAPRASVPRASVPEASVPRASGARTSAPATRSGGDGGNAPSRPRAVPRGSENRGERTPDTRPDDNAYSPYSRRAPSVQPRPEPGGERPEPQRHPGVRTMPRGNSGEGGGTAPPAVRRGPDAPPAGGRAVPRSEPQNRPSPMPEQRMERRPPSRGDAPAPAERTAPSRTRPGGGDSNGQARRRRDG
jgi:hypothetical protein